MASDMHNGLNGKTEKGDKARLSDSQKAELPSLKKRMEDQNKLLESYIAKVQKLKDENEALRTAKPDTGFRPELEKIKSDYHKVVEMTRQRTAELMKICHRDNDLLHQENRELKTKLVTTSKFVDSSAREQSEKLIALFTKKLELEITYKSLTEQLTSNDERLNKTMEENAQLQTVLNKLMIESEELQRQKYAQESALEALASQLIDVRPITSPDSLDGEVTYYRELLDRFERFPILSLPATERKETKDKIEDSKVGQLQFSINYDSQAKRLILEIIGAEKLKAMDKTGTSDPYVICTLYSDKEPGKKLEAKTPIKLKILNPCWNKKFYFKESSLDSLKDKTLNLEVMDYNSLTRDNPIGSVRIPVQEINLVHGHMLWKNLVESKVPPVLPPEIPQYVSSDKPEDQTLGRLKFTISYDKKAQHLNVEILEAATLPAMDYFSASSDSYVKIFLLPDKTQQFQTKTIKKDLNPHWNEKFSFGVPYSDLSDKTLFMHVWDFDNLGKLKPDDVIGEVCIPLNYVNLEKDQTLWKNLQPSTTDAGKLGELQLSLGYHPNPGRLNVTIHKARQLANSKENLDPYVEIWLMQDGIKVEEKKTEIRAQTMDPVFEKTFEFKVPHEKIREKTTLQVNVLDAKVGGRKIGHSVFGFKNGPMEMKHWVDMLNQLEQPVTRWHVLKELN